MKIGGCSRKTDDLRHWDRKNYLPHFSGASWLVAIAPRSQSCAEVRPNPSIEGMPKRLRLLCTPHVKR